VAGASRRQYRGKRRHQAPPMRQKAAGRFGRLLLARDGSPAVRLGWRRTRGSPHFASRRRHQARLGDAHPRRAMGLAVALAAEDAAVVGGRGASGGSGNDVMDLEVVGRAADHAGAVPLEDPLPDLRGTGLMPSSIRGRPRRMAGAAGALGDPPSANRAEAPRHQSHPRIRVGSGGGAVRASWAMQRAMTPSTLAPRSAWSIRQPRRPWRATAAATCSFSLASSG
jgi:hypothetical protein